MCDMEAGDNRRSSTRSPANPVAPPGQRPRPDAQPHASLRRGGRLHRRAERWALGTEITAYRIGFLLCDDLITAAHLISQEQAAFGSSMTPKDKNQELVLYSISEDYFKARKGIGVSVA